MTSDPAREAWRLLQTLAYEGEAHGRARAACAEVGLQPSLVKALFRLSEDEPRAMREMAGDFGCDASYVTTLVDGLERRGLAQRRAHPTDGRVRTVVLTPAGARARARVQQLLGEPPPALRSLPDADLRRLAGLLARVVAADSVLAGDDGDAPVLPTAPTLPTAPALHGARPIPAGK